MGVFNLADQFMNYFEYHRNPVNQLIHFVFVPVLTFSFTMLFCSVRIQWPFLTSFFSPENPYVMNLGFLFVVLVCLYYLILDRLTGSILVFEFASFLYISVLLLQNLDKSKYYFVAGMIQLIGWTTQFAGHAFFEGKRPALMDNGLQVFIAPLFVMVEAMFFLGLKQDLKREVHKRMNEKCK
jgi:uncharacterized membrane protein YGL010W